MTPPALLPAVILHPSVVVFPIEAAEAVPLSVVHSAPPAAAAVQVIGLVAHLAQDGPQGNPAEIASSVTLQDMVPGVMVFMSSALAIRVWRRSSSEIQLIHRSSTLA